MGYIVELESVHTQAMVRARRVDALGVGWCTHGRVKLALVHVNVALVTCPAAPTDTSRFAVTALGARSTVTRGVTVHAVMITITCCNTEYKEYKYKSDKICIDRKKRLLFERKGRDLTQSYDKKPLNPQKNPTRALRGTDRSHEYNEHFC